MKKKILVVEDQLLEAANVRITLERAGYSVCPVAVSYESALTIIDQYKPDIVLLDIFLDGGKTGIDLAKVLKTKGLPFVYLSANSGQKVLDAAKPTEPYGFLVKPFRDRDLLVTLDIAGYLHRKNQQLREREKKAPAVNSAVARVRSGIVGKSPALMAILDKLDVVSGMDTAVLITGESGTGKERIADYIHTLSPRSDKPFIKINCAALPELLVESELFGHERGSFTGALGRQIGKFEQANGGTIFLDEIGELSPGIQAKLLRVLQEKEIERIGGNKTIPIDVRIISATNRVLEREIAAGRFRIDLYYRLNVFPIELPPLRDRLHDIPLLVAHFIEKCSLRTGKKVEGISGALLAKLQEFSWPGNIRELEHYIERSILLTRKGIIEDVPLPVAMKRAGIEEDEPILKTFIEKEKEVILAALTQSKGKIAGPGGAAELLDLPVSTLNGRMKKLGIVNEKYWR